MPSTVIKSHQLRVQETKVRARTFHGGVYGQCQTRSNWTIRQHAQCTTDCGSCVHDRRKVLQSSWLHANNMASPRIQFGSSLRFPCGCCLTLLIAHICYSVSGMTISPWLDKCHQAVCFSSSLCFGMDLRPGCTCATSKNLPS